MWFVTSMNIGIRKRGLIYGDKNKGGWVRGYHPTHKIISILWSLIVFSFLLVDRCEI